jgi:hypothetical protein
MQSLLILPNPPASEMAAVKAWEEPVVMTTYLPVQPDPNPLFLEKRVYQSNHRRTRNMPTGSPLHCEFSASMRDGS